MECTPLPNKSRNDHSKLEDSLAMNNNSMGSAVKYISRSTEKPTRTPYRAKQTNPQHHQNNNNENSNRKPTSANKYNNNNNKNSNSPNLDRRMTQRVKQIQFGYATDGYRNMVLLIESDPLLQEGKLLPIAPPSLTLHSKRQWDIELRKWRRALHMFDYVYLDDDEEQQANKKPVYKRTEYKKVVEAQRRQWVSEAFQSLPKSSRIQRPLELLYQCRHTHRSIIPTKIPLEEDLKGILRREEYFEDIRNVVPQEVSSLTRGSDSVSPSAAGIKIHIAPSSAVLRKQQEQQLLMSAFKQDNNNNSPSTVPHYLGREGTSPRPTAPEYAANTNNTAEEDYVAQRLTYSTSVGRSDLPPPPTDHKSVPPHVVRGPSGSPYHPHKVFVDPNFAPPYMPPANGFASPYPPHPWHYNTMSKSCAPPTPPYYTPNHTNNVNHNTPMDYNHYCRAVAAHESLLHMAQQQASAAVSTAATTNNNNTYTKYNNNNNNNNNNPATVPRYVTLLSDPNKKENEKISVDHTKPKKFLAKPSIKPEYQTDTKNNNNKYNNEVEMEEVVKPQRVLFSSDVIHDKNDYQNNEGEDILQNSYCPSN